MIYWSKKILPLVAPALAFFAVYHSQTAFADSGTCEVLNAGIRYSVSIPNPNGDDNGNGETNFQEYFYAGQQGNLGAPYVYFDIITSGCLDSNSGWDMKVALNEEDTFFDDEIDGIEQLDDWPFDVPADSFTIAFRAGEDECGQSTEFDCRYELLTWDHNSNAQQWDALRYDCHLDCQDDWQYLGFLPYHGVLQQDQQGVTPPSSQNGNFSVSSEYLEPLPGLAGQDADLKGFLQGIFNIAIVIAGILAILMIVIGGVTYATTDAFSKKETGIGMITNAIFGLILALGAWIILNTINPDLASNLNITIPELILDSPPPEWQDGGASTGSNIAKGRTLNGQPITQGMPWPSDSAQRQQLADDGITVNTTNDCSPTAGGSGCTSVYFEGEAASVIDNMISFKSVCNCEMVVTGGSEAWLHRTHAPNRKIVDLRATESLNSYLRGLPGGPSPGTGFPRRSSITVSGVGKFYAEPSGDNSNTTNQHWHVNFY